MTLSKQRSPDFPPSGSLPAHLEEHRVVSKSAKTSLQKVPGVPWGLLPAEHTLLRRHLSQMPGSPQLAPCDVDEQKLYSKILLNDIAPHPTSKREPNQPFTETLFPCLVSATSLFQALPILSIVDTLIESLSIFRNWKLNWPHHLCLNHTD